MSKDTDNVYITQKRSFGGALGDVVSLFGPPIFIMGIGVVLDSSAMQWFGFVVSFIFIGGMADNLKKKRTPQAAADYLLAEYDVSSSKEEAS